jgi:protein-S-isoprenylcysteine O-methyltransferase Ste14
MRACPAFWNVCGESDMNLDTKAWLGLFVIALAMAFVLFGTAGTLAYWQAWVWLAVYVAASAAITLYLMKHDRALLARRMRGGPTAETRPVQKIAMLIAVIAFVAILAVPALDHRFGWSRVPVAVIVLGDAMTALFFWLMFLVFRENSFTAATVEIAPDQRVISTGPYALVRHPMYAGAVFLFVGAPLALGSYWGILAFVAALPALIWRMFDEERMLARELPGYPDYCARVRWRLIPGVF